MKTKDFWTDLLKEFTITEVPNSSVEILTSDTIDAIEYENSFRLPDDYKFFCETFGTCSFRQGKKIYCPNISLSEKFLYPSREEFLSLIETNHFPANISRNTQLKIETLLSGYGVVFCDDISARIYIFDTRSYKPTDRSCDIWSADGEGLLDDFHIIGRNFYNFFVEYCIGNECPKVLEEEDVAFRVSREDKVIRRFNSKWYNLGH